MDYKNIMVIFILTLACIGFIYGIGSAVYYSIKGQPDLMPSFLRQVVTGIGGILATNLGAVLGIKVEQAKKFGFDVGSFLWADAADAPSMLQVGAAYLYLIGMLVALIGWIKLKFSEDPTQVVNILPQLSITLLGVCMGVLAVSIG